MILVDPSYQILYPNVQYPEVRDLIYERIELIGRTCYKSEDRITDGSAEKFVRSLIGNRHEAMLEHASMTVKFVVDRGVSHELVRHRVASFAQESTRYCNYSKDKFGKQITFVRPYFLKHASADVTYAWINQMQDAENAYFKLLDEGCSPEAARSVLPNSTKTEIVVTADFREFRHIFKLRAAGESGKPHPDMLAIMVPLLKECRTLMPALFDDIEPMALE